MVEHSKGFRIGRLISCGPRGKMQSEDGIVPYVVLRMHSSIPIGFGEISEEDTVVLLVGDSTVEWWESMLPSPKVGDTIRVSYATMYVRNGMASMRVLDSSMLEVIPQAVANSAPSMDTYKTINAKDFFRKFFAEQNQRQKSET